MGLFLTEVAHFANCARWPCPRVRGNDGQARLLAMLQGFVANQGDGWTYSLEMFVGTRAIPHHPAGDLLPPQLRMRPTSR